MNTKHNGINKILKYKTSILKIEKSELCLKYKREREKRWNKI